VVEYTQFPTKNLPDLVIWSDGWLGTSWPAPLRRYAAGPLRRYPARCRPVGRDSSRFRHPVPTGEDQTRHQTSNIETFSPHSSVQNLLSTNFPTYPTSHKVVHAPSQLQSDFNSLPSCVLDYLLYSTLILEPPSPNLIRHPSKCGDRSTARRC
jgi:hypothetical protein